ncbi:MAG: hypothetical protein KGS72_28295 [Cyanobacteria bacterium REEB67]|nr:hypothetical protein [Cyanobacteria bacterium REEB67]
MSVKYFESEIGSTSPEKSFWVEDIRADLYDNDGRSAQTKLIADVPDREEITRGPAQEGWKKEEQKLEHYLDGIIASDRARIRENMRQFERRAQAEHLASDEVRRNYVQVNRLYESQTDTPILQPDKQLVADQVIAHAARPHDIDQGLHFTCNVTAIESRLFSKSPAEVAKVIADLGTAGSYTAINQSIPRKG